MRASAAQDIVRATGDLRNKERRAFEKVMNLQVCEQPSGVLTLLIKGRSVKTPTLGIIGLASISTKYTY